ncbi:MAG: hypothetical protein IKZ99_05545 [Salinivirgaceae bacterium]|nr:hypothetical protein [Salinivirgaceae bacterium]
MNTALVVIELQNEITKNYKDIIGDVYTTIDRSVAKRMHIAYINNMCW